MPLVYPNMILSEVVAEHTSLIPVLNRLGIRLGLGDESVKAVCEAHQLDTDFLLMILNTYLNEEYFPEKKLQSFHTSQIIDYLTKTNQYYERFQLPNITRHLNSFIAMNPEGNYSLAVIGKFFAEFKNELIKRIQNDQKNWFPYCLSLSRQDLSRQISQTNDFSTGIRPEADDPIEALLSDIKRIMIKHITGDYDENLCYAVLFSISSLEKDIKQHNRIRYRILVPMITAMEQLNK